MVQKVDYELVLDIQLAPGYTTCAKFNPEGSLIAVSFANGTIQVLDQDGHRVKELKGHTLGVSDLSWSDDGRYLASASDDTTVKIWSIESFKCVKTLVGHTYHVNCVKFNHKGNLLISGSSDEAIRVWDINNSKCLKTLCAHSDPISAVDLSWDGTIIVSASYDGLIRLFDTQSGQCLKTLIYDGGDVSYPVSYVRFSPNGKYILASTLDGAVRLWDYMDNKVVKTFFAHKQGIGEVSKTDMGKYNCNTDFFIDEKDPSKIIVVSGSDFGSVFLWDVKSRKLLSLLQASEESPILHVQVNNGKLLTLSRVGECKVYQL
ncbi:hypothetical protein LJB42_003746 [Komagataella kurtzmanii]|nr:hypothetical protein LJB42_003746 [Komagataella kurtzmanii]